MKNIRPFAALLIAAALPACKTTAPAQPDRFAAADRDGNGELTAHEFSDYTVADIFAGRDTNGDGFITKEEWNPQMTAEETKLFNLRDTNKDGKVSLAEAQAYALKAGTYTGDLSKVDTNKNGTVSRAEAVAYYASKEGSFR